MVHILTTSISILMLIPSMLECSSFYKKSFCRVSLSPQSSSMRCFDEMSQNVFSLFFNVQNISSQKESFLSTIKALTFNSYSCDHGILFTDKSTNSSYLANCSFSNTTVTDFEDVIDLSIITELKVSEFLDFSLDDFSNTLRSLSITNTDVFLLPDNVFSKLIFLNELILSKIKLQEIKRKHFEHLKNLTKLDLSDNLISRIPGDVFNDISELRILSLSGNSIVVIDMFAFQFLANLKVLDLSSCLIELWHEEIFLNLSSLIKLNLSDNNIKSIPVWIFEPLKFLEELNLSKNKIDTISYMLLRKQKNMKYLDISKNRLTSISSQLLRLKNLEVLNLSGNLINFVQDTNFNDLKNLRIFNISHNVISNFEFNIYDNLNNLEVLDASYNNIIEIAFDRSLTHVNIYSQEFHKHNNNSTFGCSSSKLKQISFDHNDFESVNFLRDESCFFTSIYDVQISLKHNLISEFDVTLLMKQENYCQQKYIENCDLLNISNIFLDISFNPLDCDCLLYEFHQHLKESSGIKFYTFTNLQNLRCQTPHFLRNYTILSVEDDAFACLFTEDFTSKCDNGIRAKDKRIFVNCTNLGLDEVSIEPPESTTILYFNQNHLKDLASLNNEAWINITDLYLDDNDIGTLDGWNIPPNLQYLSLRGNRLKYVSFSLMEFISNRNYFQLLFERNDRNCDCDSEKFKIFLINEREFVPDVEKVFCDLENNGEIILTPLVSVSEEVLCAEEILSKLTQNALISFFSILIFLIVIVFFIYLKMRMEVHSFIYIHCGHICCFRSEENDSEHRTFDAFVAYSNYDQPIVLDLLKELEEKEPRFQLCIHERDWIAGNDITKNILVSVQNSKRNIFVISENFIASPWFKVELTAATSEGRMNPFIIILLDKSTSLKNMNKHFRRIISKKTYLEWGERWFWEKLRYALPHKKSGHIASTAV